MKIGPLESKPPVAVVERKPTAPVPQARAEASAQVALSPAAAALSGGADATFDSAKVERIAQAIRDGQFSINPEVIADKLIANAEELLGRKLSS